MNARNSVPSFYKKVKNIKRNNSLGNIISYVVSCNSLKEMHKIFTTVLRAFDQFNLCTSHS